jgi:hypothetical protein
MPPLNYTLAFALQLRKSMERSALFWPNREVVWAKRKRKSSFQGFRKEGEVKRKYVLLLDTCFNI